jgi:predicted ATPase
MLTTLSEYSVRGEAIMKSRDQVRIVDTFISNFRSFAPRDVREGPNIGGLSNINIFVGSNGSGKSNYFNALRDRLTWPLFNSMGTLTLEKNHNDSSKPINIKINVEARGNTHSVTLRQSPDTNGPRLVTRKVKPDLAIALNEHTFPIGLPRNFHEYNRRLKVDAKDSSYRRILANWSKIRVDAKRLGIKLRGVLPEAPQCSNDRFFFDMFDNNEVPFAEGSDGVSNILCMIIGIRILPSGSVLWIEEPEVGLHPGLQKQFMSYLSEIAQESGYQFLVSTHSPYIMNYATDDNTVRIFRFSKDDSGNTQVRLISQNNEKWNLLRDLGHSPADVMHANGVVWVEGPSDVVYFTSWLAKLAPDLTPDKDFTVMFYGGNEWSQFGAEYWENANARTKLVDLFSLNPNWAFIADGDMVAGKSRISQGHQDNKGAVERICERHGQYSWFIDDRIEKCIRRPMKNPNDKMESAREYKTEIQGYSAQQVRQTLTPTALGEIRRLAKTIRTW